MSFRELLKSFHTGGGYHELKGGSYYHNGIRFSRVQSFNNILDDGSIEPVAPWNVTPPDQPYKGLPIGGATWDELTTILQAIYDWNMTPCLGLWIENWETVSEAGLRAFLTKLSTWLGNRWLIWEPCWEFNVPVGWSVPPNPVSGGVHPWRILPDDYNRVMSMIKSLRDSLGAYNIIIGSHLHSFLYELPEWGTGSWTDFYLHAFKGWLDGIRQADVVGPSGYCVVPRCYEDPSLMDRFFERYRLMNETIGGNTFFMFEWNIWEDVYPTTLETTPEFVERTYNKIIQENQYIKGLIWFLPMNRTVGHPTEYYSPNLASEKLRELAVKYDGYTPIPPLTLESGLAISLGLLDLTLIVYYGITHIEDVRRFIASLGRG